MKFNVELSPDLTTFAQRRAAERGFDSVEELLVSLIEGEQAAATEQDVRRRLHEQYQREAGPGADAAEVLRRVDRTIAEAWQKELAPALAQLDRVEGVEFTDADVDSILAEGRRLLAQPDAQRRTA